MGLKVDLPKVLTINNKGAVDIINSFSVGGGAHITLTLGRLLTRTESDKAASSQLEQKI
jgi:hypothetical protein